VGWGGWPRRLGFMAAAAEGGGRRGS
jgi:hypothetical protein